MADDGTLLLQQRWLDRVIAALGSILQVITYSLDTSGLNLRD